MTENYQTAVQSVASAMNAVYENKQVNKKDDISGDYSSDSVSYPTVKAVKSTFGTKVTSWSSSSGSDSNYPSEALVKGALNSINNSIETLSGLEVIKVVSTKPTASADTMNQLYIVSENSKVNVYYTTKSGSTYSWKKMDTDILDELVLSWNDIQNKPSFGTGQNDFARGDHNHDSTYVSLLDTRLEDNRNPLVNSFNYLTDDIDDIITTGFWMVPLNIEYGPGIEDSMPSVTLVSQTMDAMLFVIASNEFVKQIFIYNTETYIRYGTGSNLENSVTWGSWKKEVTATDVQSEISAFATALASAINPSS